uniref:Ring finger protein 25 n=1 Tax=Cyclopterus lumpus TaxID=8103 RepID=A0A8C2WKI0_CYCLU
TPVVDWEVSLVLYPSTAEDSVSQFVRLTLTLTLDQQYPSSSPDISIHNPRGLSDDKISSVQRCLQLEAQSCLGSPVLYQLIEVVLVELKRSLMPPLPPQEGETFSKTSCYHYFHSHCLGRYASHSERELLQREKELEEDKTRERADHQELTVVCPVCREPLTYDVDQLLRCPAPQLPELDGAAIGSTFQHKWRKLQKLLERQKSRGGIIDPEAESKRFLIHTNERRQGPRRGGRSRPHHRRPPHVSEHLDQLSLSSDGTGGPMKGGGVPADPPETPPPADGRGPRGSRRGPHRPDSDAGARGRHHWDGRAPRSRGGPGSLYSRGEGGPRWGHAGGFQHQVVERRGEEVL